MVASSGKESFINLFVIAASNKLVDTREYNCVLVLPLLRDYQIDDYNGTKVRM